MSIVTRVEIPPDGQFTLPDETREALGIRPGVVVLVRAIGERKAEIEVLPEPDDLPTMTLDEMIERFQSYGPFEPYDD